MKYKSTRGLDNNIDFSNALMMGLASDGGLMMPDYYPILDDNQLSALRHLSYAELAFEIMKRYVSDIPEVDLQTIINKTYTSKVFQSEDITPVTQFKNGSRLLHLSNGPTLAFKDIAMQFLGNAFEYILKQKNSVLNIVGATSGDTGSAAEYAMKGKHNINVFMLSPYGKMSDFQRAQMYSLQDENIFNIAVEGLFDDCQNIVKQLQTDLSFKNQYHISTVNSINWGRILAQIVYYFKAYFAVTKHNQELVSFCVPSGNFGDICAGHIAKSMGLPIEKLIVATNENNVLEDFFNTGIYRPRKTQEVHITSSPSMDIAKASNLERFIFDLVEQNPKKLQALWQDLETKGFFDVSEHLNDIHQKYGFEAGSSNHQHRLEQIKAMYNTNHYLIDPHTADGFYIAQSFGYLSNLICLETALPMKFEATVKEALGQEFNLERTANWTGLETMPQHYTKLPNQFEHIKQFIQSKLD